MVHKKTFSGSQQIRTEAQHTCYRYRRKLAASIGIKQIIIQTSKEQQLCSIPSFLESHGRVKQGSHVVQFVWLHLLEMTRLEALKTSIQERLVELLHKIRTLMD